MRRLVLVLALAAVSCGSGTSDAAAAPPRAEAPKRARVVRRRPTPAPLPAVTPSLLVGQWGGEHVNFQFDGNVATIELDCASATFAPPLTMDAKGGFEATGTFQQQHGGPVRQGEQPNTTPARFVGTTDGQTMTLVMFNATTGETLGKFELSKGKAARIFRCY